MSKKKKNKKIKKDKENLLKSDIVEKTISQQDTSENKSENKKNEVSIVMICDSNYIVPTCVTITSLLKNKKSDSYYHIYILGDKLKKNDKTYFDAFQGKDQKVTVIDCDADDLKDLHSSSKKGYCVATTAALLKFEIPNILYKLDKVIYLDGDLICRGDLTRLYNTKLNGAYAAVVMDSGKLYSGREIVRDHPKYFNTGVMVLNLTRMREENTAKKLIETKKYMTDKSLMDQNVINLVFGEDTVLLPIKYNYLYVNLLRALQKKNFTINDLNKMYGTSYKDLTDIRKDSIIIHFSSKDKPWKYYDVRLADEWYKYFQESPVSDFTLNRVSILPEKYLDQIKTQKNEIRKLEKEIAAKNELINSLQCQLSETRKSFTYKAGRSITYIPRHLRVYSDKMEENKEKLRYQLPQEPVLNHKKRDIPIIVSLTSYSIRINYVSLVIASIMHQTVKPDRIILYLAKDEFSMNTIPSILKKQMKLGLEIVFCEDLRSHKKYYYAMKDNPESIIITVDDDIIYQTDLIELLYNSYKKFPDCVSAMRVHRMKVDANGKILPYSRWKQRDKSRILEPSFDLFPTGCGGVLYPPHILHKDVFNIEDIKKLCLTGDDVWLKAMALKNNKKAVLAAWQNPLDYIPETQEVSLFNDNVFNDGNDKIVDDVFDKYFANVDMRTYISF